MFCICIIYILYIIYDLHKIILAPRVSRHCNLLIKAQFKRPTTNFIIYFINSVACILTTKQLFFLVGLDEDLQANEIAQHDDRVLSKYIYVFYSIILGAWIFMQKILLSTYIFMHPNFQKYANNIHKKCIICIQIFKECYKIFKYIQMIRYC